MGHENAEKVQSALYRIAELASAAQDMEEFYRAIHEVVGELMDASNFALVLYDEERRRINWPYYVDEVDTDIPDPGRWEAVGEGEARGTTAYMLRTGQPQLIDYERWKELVERGDIEPLGVTVEESSWIGVPLKAEGHALGALVVQSYTKDVRYTEQDKDMLAFVGQHVGAALSRARAIEETRQRNAELALINSVQSALAGELEMQAIYDVVGDKIQEVFDAQVVDIWTYDTATDLVHCQYSIERGERQSWEPYSLESLGFMKLVIETGAPILIKEDVAGTRERLALPKLTDDEPKSSLQVPLLAGGTVTGLVALQNMDREHAFDEGDQRLLTTLAGSLSVALENARLVHETRQRNAELALINSVQSALAGELEMQAIYEVVGDKIQEIFDAQGTSIATFDETSGLLHHPYLIERGERLHVEPLPLGGFSKHVLETREPLMINEDLAAEAERYGSSLLAGEFQKCTLLVPLVTGGRATGVIALDNFDREHAFDESDQRLLTTLASSLSVALENARLVHETRQRNAELALINSVQAALAGELEMQAIYDVVGDRIQEIFDAQVVDIGFFDFAAGLTRYPYSIERGVRFPDEPKPIEISPTSREILETKAAVLLNDIPAAAEERGEVAPVLQGEPALSMLVAPLISGGEVRGRISLQNLDRTNAFTEDDVRLLTTLASSLSVALENARLVHETRQRNAELALINGVQDAIAGELDPQAIYDAVGDKIQEIFDAQIVSIRTVDEATGLLQFAYLIERGERLQIEPTVPLGFSKHVLASREPLLIVENMDAESARYGSATTPGTDDTKSGLFVPLVSGGKATGLISLESLDEHAFGESDQQLLETLAGGLSVALENARLVHETRQRNAELALINSVQDAIAGELDPQAIYDAVGDKIREIFDAQTVSIRTVDEPTGLMHHYYIIERGERLQAEPTTPAGFSKHVLASRESLLIVENMDAEIERYGSAVLPGTDDTKSVLFVPLVSGGKAMGLIALESLDEHAFGESDQQLLETLAGSLSVALENARLVHETRQRNAELALINSVQSALAGELDMQAIYDVVGDKIQEIFEADSVDIAVHDTATGLLDFAYVIERGVRLGQLQIPLMGFRKHVIETREPLNLNGSDPDVFERYDNPRVLQGEETACALFVPLIVGGRATGVISLQNFDRERAFGESDQQLLETLAGSLSVALENARLVHETRQRNAELALINSVQDAIAGELDPQAIYDAVGDRIRDVFDAQVVSIATLDEASGLVHYPYMIERGDRLQAESRPLAGFTKHVLETREPLLLAENLDVESERYGSVVVAGETAKSVLFVPLVAGGKAAGVISLQNIDREHAFDEDAQRLLTTLAGSLAVALENARLVQETRQRLSELATVNSVGQALSSQLDPDALIELVGEHVRETFDADIAYVALHNEAAGQIDFAYYHESGQRREEPSIAYGKGLTSRIVETREPLLLNREEHYEGQASVGTPSRSYLGVPILVGDNAIGVISVQSIAEEGRFGEADARLLATIAANVGVAIQNARLFTEVDRQKQYFESLVEISPAAIVVMDAAERVTGWNPAAAALFGYTSDEAVGRAIEELVVPDELRSESRDVTIEALEGIRTHRITRRARKDGELLDVEMELVPLRFDGEHVGFYAIYHDITELQRARQEAEAATQAKSAFLATMSHEIRTPMNAVIGMTDLLLGTELTGEQREFAEVVHSSGDALLHVIDDILDYSKIEAGKLDLEREPFSLRDCVEGALDIVAPRAWEKELELGCLIDERAPIGILGDEARLRQVLLNLLSNAVKFTERGEVFVLVSAEETRAGSYQVELAVRDTGIGIPPDRMDRLFTSFSQVDASTTRRFGGTGLGLAISKRLVELMGGTISVESEEDKGSVFSISLPAVAAEVPAKIALEEGLPHLSGRRILIVDDNATNREIVTRHAQSWGMEPVAVELPTAALELIEQGEQFDVAVLDMMMPDMDGVALAREIRKRRSAEDLPLLLLTSVGRLSQGESSEVFSAQLTKPLKASQLYNALLSLLTAGGAPEERVAPVSEGTHVRSTLRILLAEDNAMNQKVALRLLERLGYRADVAVNGLEAIAALERQPYDVVLMDMQMPELDGLDATRRICEQWPPETRPHIVAMTANALPEDREACFAAGMNDYVAKPIRSEELAAALKRVKPKSLAAAANGPAGGDVKLDSAALASLRELGGDDFLGEVIDAFLADAPELVATLRRALDEESPEELRRAAHTLKANGATLGAGEFAELCSSLEQRAKAGQLDGAAELVDRIEQEYRPFEGALASLRAGAPL